MIGYAPGTITPPKDSIRWLPLIIALCGPDRVGKSGLARAIRDGVGPLAVCGGIVSFASPIHELALALCPHDKADPRGREWMRRCGASLRTTFGRDVLINAAKSRMSPDANLHIIDDLRTDDEARWVHSRGGWVVELQRDGVAYSGVELDARIDHTMIDATVPLLETGETARHILRLTGWLA
jgi:hypothetical protein